MSRKSRRQALQRPVVTDKSGSNAVMEIEEPALGRDSGWSSWAVQWFPPLAIALLALLFFYPSIHGQYIWDDDAWLTKNDLVLHPGMFWSIWNPMNEQNPHFYPLVFTSFWMEYRLWGLGTMGADRMMYGIGYHVDNLLLHIGSALVIFQILKRMRLPGGLFGAWLAAAIFAVHPVNVESVAWIAERKNCLCGIFFFSSLYFGMKFFRIFDSNSELPASANGKFDIKCYAACMILLLCAMFSKTIACTLPPALLVLIWWRRGRIRGKELLLSMPLFVIAIGIGALSTAIEHGRVGTTGPDWQFSLYQRVLIAGSSVWFYLGKIFWPYPLMQVYPRFPINAGQPVPDVWTQLAPYVLLGMLAILFLVRKRISRGPIAAMLLFIGTLFPALGFISFYTQLYTFVADHYQYLSIPFIIVLAVEVGLYLLRRACELVPERGEAAGPLRLFRLTRSLIAAGLLLSLGMLAYGASSLYLDSEQLWQFNVDNNPKGFFPLVETAIAKSLKPNANYLEAETLLQRALTLSDDWRAYNTLGLLYLQMNQPDKAKEYLDGANKRMPEFVREKRANFYANAADAANSIRADSLGAGVAEAIYGSNFRLGIHFEAKNQFDKAIASFEDDLKEFPGNLEAMLNIGNCYLFKGDNAHAAEWFRKAIDRNPNYAEAHLNLGAALRGLGDEKGAELEITKAWKIDPNLLSRNPELMKAAADQLRNHPQ